MAPNKKLYDFNFVDMDYEAVFRSVSVIAGVDILIAPDVKGKMSLKVTKKTWQETLDIHGVLYDLSAGGILLGIPVEIPNGEHIRIRFELPSFGMEDVEIEILRNLGQKNPEYPDYYSLTASFAGAFGWTQERVLQYIFEVHKARKETEMAEKNA